MRRLGILLSPLLLIVPPVGSSYQAPLIVHEWGTITTRHASDGTPQGKLNHISESEVLPAFVHRFEPAPVRNDPGKSLQKTTLTPGRPDVTMRLETPVIYFHPSAGSATSPPFEVKVMFRGGIVNEFYPGAQASVAVDYQRVATKMQAGLIKSWDGAVLDNYVVGSLDWKQVSLRTNGRIPSTTSPLWLAPRQVQSAPVMTSSGEGERYLFYRGVAHLDALLQTRLSQSELVLSSPQRLLWLASPSMTISNLWLVDIGAPDSVAFREIPALSISREATSRELARVPRFQAGEYSSAAVGRLRASMKQALVGAGLFDDEAEAMLETWKESYFRHPGLRIFYLVPKEWISYFLPLDVSVPNELTRVLVGRIDLLQN